MTAKSCKKQAQKDMRLESRFEEIQEKINVVESMMADCVPLPKCPSIIQHFTGSICYENNKLKPHFVFKLTRGSNIIYSKSFYSSDMTKIDKILNKLDKTKEKIISLYNEVDKEPEHIRNMIVDQFLTDEKIDQIVQSQFDYFLSDFSKIISNKYAGRMVELSIELKTTFYGYCGTKGSVTISSPPNNYKCNCDFPANFLTFSHSVRQYIMVELHERLHSRVCFIDNNKDALLREEKRKIELKERREREERERLLRELKEKEERHEWEIVKPAAMNKLLKHLEIEDRYTVMQNLVVANEYGMTRITSGGVYIELTKRAASIDVHLNLFIDGIKSTIMIDIQKCLSYAASPDEGWVLVGINDDRIDRIFHYIKTKIRIYESNLTRSGRRLKTLGTDFINYAINNGAYIGDMGGIFPYVGYYTKEG